MLQICGAAIRQKRYALFALLARQSQGRRSGPRRRMEGPREPAGRHVYLGNANW